VVGRPPWGGRLATYGARGGATTPDEYLGVADHPFSKFFFFFLYNLRIFFNFFLKK
jgi:hypothetical protein